MSDDFGINIKKSTITEELAKDIRLKVNQEKIPLQSGQEDNIAKKFFKLLTELKKKLSGKSYSHFSKKNNAPWTEDIGEKIIALSEQLKNLFSPIEQAFSPNHRSAYWSLDGRKRAEKAGIDLAHTVIGSVLTQIMPKIQSTFKTESTFNFILWSALSKLYTEETSNDAHIFIPNGEIHCQSIFWNTELYFLRKGQAQGNINQLFLHMLKPNVMQQYQILLEKKLSSYINIKNITHQIDSILTDENNWYYEQLDFSDFLKIKTTENKTIRFQNLKKYADIFHKKNILVNSLKKETTKLSNKKNADNLLSVATKIIQLSHFNKNLGGLVIINNYLNIQKINLLFKAKSRIYKKKTPILARKVCPHEIGTELITYIATPNHPSGYKIETRCKLSEGMVIVRAITALHDSMGNPFYDKIGNIIYNEYAMQENDFLGLYADPNQLSEHFNQKFYKKSTITAIEIDDEVISILSNHETLQNSDDIFIKTAWGIELLEYGGLLTDSGYAISKKSVETTYEPYFFTKKTTITSHPNVSDDVATEDNNHPNLTSITTTSESRYTREEFQPSCPRNSSGA